MLAYLIARGGTPSLRDEVAEALWPDGDRAQVDQLLYNATYYLRRTLKSSLGTTDIQPLAVSAQRYQLRSSMFRVDVDAFDAHLRRAEGLDGSEALVEYERALALYQGDFVGNEPYEWAEPYRREYQRRFIDAAHRAAKLAADCRDIAKAVEFYRGILTRDPIDEEAARGLLQRLDESLLPNLPVLPFDAAAARRYGEVRTDLERRGTPIGDADLRIASIALARGLTVVTGNVRHFQLVPGLAVENWLE